jgi:OmpR family response regulator RpaB
MKKPCRMCRASAGHGKFIDVRVLLIDDDVELGSLLTEFLKREGFTVEVEYEGKRGLDHALRGDAELVVLDVMLPGMDGFAVCRKVRETSRVPIIMLTARGDVMDRIVGLELGADDYLPKPFEPRELLARVQTVLRRTATPAPALEKGTLRFEGLEIDLDRRQVRRQGEPVELTGTEFELLALLAGAPHKVFSRDDILERLRGHSAEDIHSRAVDILVSRLRRKLEPLDCIHTLRNAGYTFAGVRV